MSIVAAMGQGGYHNHIHPSKQEPVPSYPLNSHFTQGNYPVWTSYNGTIASGSTFDQRGTAFKLIAQWRHYSPIYNEGWSTNISNQFLFPVTEHIGDTPQNLPDSLGQNRFQGWWTVAKRTNRCIKLFGCENLFSYIDQPSVWPYRTNNDVDRGFNRTGVFSPTLGIMPRIVSNTTNTNITSSTSMYSTNIWSRHEWNTPAIAVPSSATTCKFGAYIKVGENDKLKQYNWGGVYIAEDDYTTAGSTTRHVNYFGIKNSTNNYSLPTGTLTGQMANNNWNGLQYTYPASGNNHYYFNPETTYVTEHAMLDQDDYETWQLVEYSFTLQGSGSGRNLSLGIFFAESLAYMKVGAGDFTGGVQFYSPFVEFS